MFVSYFLVMSYWEIGRLFFCQELFGYLEHKTMGHTPSYPLQNPPAVDSAFHVPPVVVLAEQISQPTAQMFLTPALNASWLTLTNRSKRGLLSPAQGLWRGKAWLPGTVLLSAKQMAGRVGVTPPCAHAAMGCPLSPSHTPAILSVPPAG